MPNPRYITLTEAQDLIQALPGSATKSDMLIHLDSFAEFVEDGSSRIILYEGDIALPYLAVKDDIVIINGDLAVAGTLADCLEVNISLMLALGNVSTKDLFTFSQICVAGNLTVENAIIADSTCDYSLDVAGDVKAHLILEDGHWFDIKGKVTADDIYTSHSAKPRGVLQPNLSTEELVDEVKEKDRLDLTKAMQYLMNNNFVFRK